MEHGQIAKGLRLQPIVQAEPRYFDEVSGIVRDHDQLMGDRRRGNEQIHTAGRMTLLQQLASQLAKRLRTIGIAIQNLNIGEKIFLNRLD